MCLCLCVIIRNKTVCLHLCLFFVSVNLRHVHVVCVFVRVTDCKGDEKSHWVGVLNGCMRVLACVTAPIGLPELSSGK